jgi:hypothetical protein
MLDALLVAGVLAGTTIPLFCGTSDWYFSDNLSRPR